jgi:hypothetical protein
MPGESLKCCQNVSEIRPEASSGEDPADLLPRTEPEGVGVALTITVMRAPGPRLRPAALHPLLGHIPQGILGDSKRLRRTVSGALSSAPRNGVGNTGMSQWANNAQHSGTGCWATSGNSPSSAAESAPQFSPSSLWRVAQVVESPLATGSDVVGGNESVAPALSASAAAHPRHSYVAKPWTEEPDAVISHVRIRGCLGRAIS